MENIEKCGNCVFYKPFETAENGLKGDKTSGMCKYNDCKICVGSECGCARWQTNKHKYNE